MSASAQTALSPDLLREVNLALAKLLGCLTPANRLHHLSRALDRAARGRDVENAAALCRQILEDRLGTEVLEALAEELLPGETYFFRDRPGLEALQQEVFPRLIHQRQADRKLHLWSVGCSTGEEPLTLAMMLQSGRVNLADWTIRILATDLRARAIKAAKLGLYRDWSFRECPEWVKARFFTREDSGAWRAAPELLAQIEYGPLNLVHDQPCIPPAGGFDLIVCRNVLIYFDPLLIPAILGRFHGALAEDGWLLVAAAEASSISLDQFECVNLGGAMFFRKKPVGPELPQRGPAGGDEREAPPFPTRLAAPLRRHGAGRQTGSQSTREMETKGLDSQSPDAGWYQGQAALHLEQGDLAAAREALRRALYLDRGCALTHLLQGHLFRAEGEPDRARRAYQTALKLLEALPPNQVVDSEHQRPAGQLAAMVREMLSEPRP